MAGFDRSFLPPAQLEVAIVGDTHFIIDTESYAVEFDSVRNWPQRAAFALRRVAELKADEVVHLGDLSEEPPHHDDHMASRQKGLECIRSLGLDPHWVAGNMDIGDKPDPTMWTPPVQPETLYWFHREFGPSWKSWDTGGCHFIILNSQILNSDLPEAGEQEQWLERDLESHAGKRMFLFLHMPPFFVEEEEPDTGFYNSIDEPARGWLAALCRKFALEGLFCGHTHFRAFNRIGSTRFYVCSSTTTSRAGFYEAFTVAPPPEGGRNDPAKLGFSLLRVHEDRHSVHFIRTHGVTAGDEESDWESILTRTSGCVGDSPLGLFFRIPLAMESAGALAWPGVKRQRVRDDHPFLQTVEAGVRHARFPATDLRDPLLGKRLQYLREEGVSLSGIWIEAKGLDLAGELRAGDVTPDTVEIHLPGMILPSPAVLDKLEAARGAFSGEYCLAPYLPRERVPGRYHPRGRLGYRLEELKELDALLSAGRTGPCRVLAALDETGDIVEGMDAFSRELETLSSLSGMDLVLELPHEETDWNPVLARVLAAAFCIPGLRVYVDPFVDLDRTNDIRPGLLDRLGNPKPAYNVLRCMNTCLAAGSPPEGLNLLENPAQLELFLSQGKLPDKMKVVSTPRCASRIVPGSACATRLKPEDFPILLLPTV